MLFMWMRGQRGQRIREAPALFARLGVAGLNQIDYMTGQGTTSSISARNFFPASGSALLAFASVTRAAFLARRLLVNTLAKAD